MSSTENPSSNFQSILDTALSDYAKQTGIDLTTHPSAQILQNCNSVDAVLNLLEDKQKQFQEYRDGNRKLMNCLKPVVQPLHAVSGILGEATAMVSLANQYILSYLIASLLPLQAPFPPTKAILVGIDVLLTVRIVLLPTSTCF
jgi:glutamine synthetase